MLTSLAGGLEIIPSQNLRLQWLRPMHTTIKLVKFDRPPKALGLWVLTVTGETGEGGEGGGAGKIN